MGKRKKNKGSSVVAGKKTKNVGPPMEYQINPKYTDDASKEKIGEQLREGTPFPHVHLEEFLVDSHNLKDDVKELDWNRKENDLYSLSQTMDLKGISVEHNAVHSFRQFLVGGCRTWLAECTGVELTDEVDSTGSVYSAHDGLLPHNDLIGSRRFAFVYYLTDGDWADADGGYLQLFNANEKNEPTTVSSRLCPSSNSLVLFEVSERSWHRVEEVLSDKKRLSINGWFHSDRLLSPPKPAPLTPHTLSPATKEWTLSDAINDRFLSDATCAEAAEQFADQSELMIDQFVKESFHSLIVDACSSLPFTEIGPPCKRRIFQCSFDSIEEHLPCLLNTFYSSSFTNLASKTTGLDLSKCRQSMTFSRIERACYSVVGDEDISEDGGMCLDVHIFFGSNWEEEFGGMTIYGASDDDEELVRICPTAHSISFVLREPGVFSFLKYANSLCGDEKMFCLQIVYHNVPISE